MRPLGGAWRTCQLREPAWCLPGQGGPFYTLWPIMPVPCLPGLLDLSRLLHHAALRGVHCVAAAQRAHDCELRPDGQAAQPLLQRREWAPGASGGELAPSSACQGQGGEGLLQVRLWACPLRARNSAPEEPACLLLVLPTPSCPTTPRGRGEAVTCNRSAFWHDLTQKHEFHT